jgi:Fe-S cluster biogenesis protein NfuA
MSGACAGCAGATMTLKHGIETMMMEYIPEVTSVIGEDDVVVNPYYSDDPYPA